MMTFFSRIACIAGVAVCFNLSSFLPPAEAAAKRIQKHSVKKKTKTGKKRLHQAEASHAERNAPRGERSDVSPRLQLAVADGPLKAEERELSMEAAAYSLLGRRYRFGGDGKDGIDCSAFVKKVFSSVKVPLPRTAREQFRLGKEVAREELQPGDLMFFATYASFASHVGIYLGEGKMIHASSREGKVTVSSTGDRYLSARFLGARRMEGGNPAVSLLAELQPVDVHEETHGGRETVRKMPDPELAALMAP
jgi:cell wall-associated NlpC family hydrolase